MSEERCPSCHGPTRFQSGAPGWCDRCQPVAERARLLDSLDLFVKDQDGGIRHEFTVRTGAGLIAVERARQVREEGYDTVHDLRVGTEQLTDAAIAYALVSEFPGDPKVADRTLSAWWPWGPEAWKPAGDRLRNLVKAGALIAAAIDVEVLSFDPVPDPGEEYEARFETASDGGEL